MPSSRLSVIVDGSSDSIDSHRSLSGSNSNSSSSSSSAMAAAHRRRRSSLSMSMPSASTTTTTAMSHTPTTATTAAAPSPALDTLISQLLGRSSPVSRFQSSRHREYLAHLASTPLRTLSAESSALKAEREHIGSQLAHLALDVDDSTLNMFPTPSSATAAPSTLSTLTTPPLSLRPTGSTSDKHMSILPLVFETRTATRNSSTALSSNIDNLTRNAIPDLQNALKQFAETAKSADATRSHIIAVVDREEDVARWLEAPEVIRGCIRAGKFADAAEGISQIRRIGKRYGQQNSTVMNQIQSETEKAYLELIQQLCLEFTHSVALDSSSSSSSSSSLSTSAMSSTMFTSSSSPIPLQMPQHQQQQHQVQLVRLVEAVSLLRSLGLFDGVSTEEAESSMAMLFLQLRRRAWSTFVNTQLLVPLAHSSPDRFLLKLTSTTKSWLDETCLLYNDLFVSDESTSVQSIRDHLDGMISSVRDDIVATFGTYLASVTDPSSIASIYAMVRDSSIGSRLDIAGQLSPAFDSWVNSKIIRSGLTEAVGKFIALMDSITLPDELESPSTTDLSISSSIVSPYASIGDALAEYRVFTSPPSPSSAPVSTLFPPVRLALDYPVLAPLLDALRSVFAALRTMPPPLVCSAEGLEKFNSVFNSYLDRATEAIRAAAASRIARDDDLEVPAKIVAAATDLLRAYEEGVLVYADYGLRTSLATGCEAIGITLASTSESLPLTN
ncbi:hypothetical protein GQ42DRAFT_56299 [Ramicandelaber brevisporus]|nr:hypothetical protein GQ42DRAFT_56299 [Ramicandelaber brevisporus]